MSSASCAARRETCGSIRAGTVRVASTRQRARRSAAGCAANRSCRPRRTRRFGGWENSRIAAMPPGRKHAAHLRQAGLVIRQIAKTERHGDQVERPVADRKRSARPLRTPTAVRARLAILLRAATSIGWQKSEPRHQRRGLAAVQEPAADRPCRSRYRARAHPAAPECAGTRRTVARASRRSILPESR